VVVIAERNYARHYHSKYTLPLGWDASLVRGPLVKKLAEPEKLKISESFNDRAVLMYLRGDRHRALELAIKALEYNPHNFEAFINKALLKWKLAMIRDEELLERLTSVGKLWDIVL
jgi:hypothetical protein